MFDKFYLKTIQKQKIAILSPILLIGFMYPIFRFLPGLFGERMGWYFGLVVYWLVWGGLFSISLIGGEDLRAIIRPQKLTINKFLLVLFPLILAGLYKFATGMNYAKPNLWFTLLLLSSAVGNGFFEEVYWRGIFLRLFQGHLLTQIIWPGIWFALWHYLPGSVFSDGNVTALIVGSGMMGLYLGFLAKKTGTIWWTIIMHTVGGFIMVL